MYTLHQADDTVGENAGSTSYVLDITFNDAQWQSGTEQQAAVIQQESPDDGLEASGFTLVETGHCFRYIHRFIPSTSNLL